MSGSRALAVTLPIRATFAFAIMDFANDLLADNPLPPSPSVPVGDAAGSCGQRSAAEASGAAGAAGRHNQRNGAEASAAVDAAADVAGWLGRLAPGSSATKLQVARVAVGRLRRQARVAITERVEQAGKYVEQMKLHGALRAGTTLAVVKKKDRRNYSQGKQLKVIIRRKAIHGRGKYQRVDAATRIKLGFDKNQRHKQLGRKFDLHPKTVARNGLLIAEAVYRCQLEWLDGILRFCERHRPVSVCSSRKWDEAKEPFACER